MEIEIRKKLQQAVGEHQQGNILHAQELYQNILKIQPMDAVANHNLGLIVSSNDQLSKAIPLFKNATLSSPNAEQFWLSYIDALITDRRFEDANRAIKKSKKKGVSSQILKTYKEKLSHCMKSKRIASKEVNPQNVKFTCKMVKAETEIYMGSKKILRIINE